MITFKKGEGAGFVGILLFGVILSPFFKFVPFWLAKQTSSTGGGLLTKLWFSDQTLYDMWIFFQKFGAETWMEAMAAGVVTSIALTALLAVWLRVRPLIQRFKSSSTSSS